MVGNKRWRYLKGDRAYWVWLLDRHTDVVSEHPTLMWLSSSWVDESGEGAGWHHPTNEMEEDFFHDKIVRIEGPIEYEPGRWAEQVIAPNPPPG
jgi:hypothetical protein